MKLWVDDIRNAPSEQWAVARSVDSAISFIQTFGEQIDEISLDHDISHQVAVGELSRPYPCIETFTAVARYMAEYYKELGTAPKVTVHSSNPMGAKNIKFVLQAAGIESEYKPVGLANRLEMEV